MRACRIVGRSGFERCTCSRAVVELTQRPASIFIRKAACGREGARVRMWAFGFECFGNFEKAGRGLREMTLGKSDGCGSPPQHRLPIPYASRLIFGKQRKARTPGEARRLLFVRGPFEARPARCGARGWRGASRRGPAAGGDRDTQDRRGEEPFEATGGGALTGRQVGRHGAKDRARICTPGPAVVSSSSTSRPKATRRRLRLSA